MTTASATSLREFATVKTAAARTAIAESTWRQWITQGRITAYRWPGGQIRLLVSDIENLCTKA
jgi:excisionase family DNA binding protein